MNDGPGQTVNEVQHHHWSEEKRMKASNDSNSHGPEEEMVATLTTDEFPYI